MVNKFDKLFLLQDIIDKYYFLNLIKGTNIDYRTKILNEYHKRLDNLGNK